MHTQPEVLPFLCHGHRIVKILRILSVYGDHHPFPQIFSSLPVRITHFLANPDSLVQDLLRKFHRQVIVFYDRKDVRPRIVDMTDDLNNLSLRLHMLPAIRQQRNYYFVPADRVHRLSFRNVYIRQIPLIVRADKSIIFVLFIQPHNMSDTVRQDPHYPAFLPPASRRSGDDKLHFISLEGSVYVLLRDENIISAVLRRDKTESSRICLEDALQPFRLPPAVFSPL